MDTLSSTEFRKRFASLKDPTEVTVNGHVIGAWVPSWGEAWRALRQQAGAAVIDDRASRPFTPAPKPSQKGR